MAIDPEVLRALEGALRTDPSNRALRLAAALAPGFAVAACAAVLVGKFLLARRGP